MAHPNYTSLDRELDAILFDAVASKDTLWLDRLQALRQKTDRALDAGLLRPSQWTALVNRSANIQDMLNGD